ncbi:MAG: TolC family protein [Desulfatitalea sp.]|nr:TolC family protein [Desulfatitalea sp.]
MVSATGIAAESLQQAWDMAIAVDLGLKASRQGTLAAASQLKAAQSARLPGVSLEAGYTVLDNEPTFKADLLGQSLQLPMAQETSAGCKAMTTLPLYTGGRIQNGIDASTAMLDAAKLNETGAVQRLKLQVADAFVAVLRAGRILKVIDRQVKSLEAHARDVQNLLKSGMVAQNDLLATQVALADARQKALQATNGLDLASAAYNRLLDRPLDQPVLLDEALPETVGEDLTGLTERALAQRSELAALDRQIAALRHQGDVVRGENLPQVALSGGYLYQENRYQVYEDQWLVGVGVRWHLFDGGMVRHRAEAVTRQAAALAAKRDELASIVSLQVRQAWLDLHETHKRIEVTCSAIAQAEENLRVAQDRYVHGLATHTEVLDAETLRAASATNHANAVLDAVMAGLRLKHATGQI